MTQQNSTDNENTHGKSTMANETEGTPVMGTEACTQAQGQKYNTRAKSVRIPWLQ